MTTSFRVLLLSLLVGGLAACGSSDTSDTDTTGPGEDVATGGVDAGNAGDTAQPDASEDASEPDVSGDIAQPDVAEDTAQPDVADASEDTAQPDVPEDTAQPDVTEDTTQPDVAEDTAQPDVTEDTTRPDVVGDTTEPDTTDPDTTEPDTTEPDTTEPDTTEPDTTEPDTTEPDVTDPTTGSVRICMLPSAGIPSDLYPTVVANGSWNDWLGWGVVLDGPDDEGRYCGLIEGLAEGTYEYVHAGTGAEDDWSGWGTVGNAPLGEECDVAPDDEFGNFGFTIVAGETAETCNRWDGCSCGPPPLPCAERPGRAVPITTDGYQILMGGEPQHWKGASWSPTPIGGGPGFGPYWDRFLDADADLMQAAGITVVKTYGPINDVAVLDTLWAHGIGVLPTVFYGGSNTIEGAIENVCEFKDHPAIMGWVIGNEWNYTRLERDISSEEAEIAVEEVAVALQAIDDTRPIITVYGGMPGASTLARLDEIDVWGLNVYTGPSFGDLFTRWEARSASPMFFAEYGADAFDGRVGAENERYQADVTLSLTTEIHLNSAVNGRGVCSGGTIFEWSDEWWKYSGGAWDEHNEEPSWNNGSYADPGMHEEWWGLVRIDRTVREAYTVYASMVAPDADDPVVPRTGSAEICLQVERNEVPTAGYEVLVANGSWNDWGGYGVVLEDPDGNGTFCGTLSELVPGEYEFVFAQTGPADDYSGWGDNTNAPLGSACDWNPADEFGNWGFAITAGEVSRVCNGWGRCGCD